MTNNLTIKQELERCERWLEDKTIEYEKIKKELEELKRYPTADEVCEALSKWIKEDVPDLWNYNVYYDDGGFHYYNTEDFETYLVEHDIIDKTISFSVYLPPHLITLIGRFYANEVKGE